jgi:hypothetical protein
MTEITVEERLEKIANKGLELLQGTLETPSPGNETNLVRFTGEALKALAEGIDAYKKATTIPKKYVPG